MSSAQRRARARSSAAKTSRAVASSPSAPSCMRYARATTAKPPGVGKPARPSDARFAALGPKRAGSAASAKGTTKPGTDPIFPPRSRFIECPSEKWGLSPSALRIDHQPQDAARVALVLLEGRGRVGQGILRADEAVHVHRARCDQLDARVHVLRGERARADD